MKKIIFIVFISSFLNLFSQWEADRKLSQKEVAATLNENMGQCLAVSGDSVHVVWWDYKNNGSGVYYKHSFDCGATWSDEMRLTPNPGMSDFPSVAVAGNFVHIVYRDTANGLRTSRYIRSNDAGLTWSKDISLGEFYWWPSVCAYGNNVFVALNSDSPDNSEVYLRRSTDNGFSWDSTVRISNAPGRSEDPAVSADAGNVYLAWNDNRSGTMEIFYRHSSDDGLSWGKETKMSDSGVKITYAPMINALQGDVDLVWMGGTGVKYRHSSDYGATWDRYDSLCLKRNVLYPTLKRSAKLIHLVTFNMTAGIYYLRSVDGGISWDRDTIIVRGTGKPSRAFIGAGGKDVHLVWTDQRDGHQAIYYKRYRNGNNEVTDFTEENFSNTDESIRIFPDPVRINSLITFDFGETIPINFAIVDILGNEVFGVNSLNINRNRYIKNGLQYSFSRTGLYFAQLTYFNRKIVYKLIVTD